MPESLEPKTADGKAMSIADRFKNQSLISIFLLCCAAAVGTWAVENQLYVLPRDFTIQRLERDLAAKKNQTESSTTTSHQNDSSATASQIIYKRGWVSKGHPISTDDGNCLIAVNDISGRPGEFLVNLSVTVEGEAPLKFQNVASEKRLSFFSREAAYYIDIAEITKTQVAIQVTRKRFQKPA